MAEGEAARLRITVTASLQPGAVQEWQLHLERMLERVRVVARDDLRQRRQRGDRVGVERDAAERRLERTCGRQREAAQGDAVRRPEQHHSAYRPARIGDRCSVPGQGGDFIP